MSIIYTKLLRNLSYKYGIHTGKLMSLPANPKYRFTHQFTAHILLRSMQTAIW